MRIANRVAIILFNMYLFFSNELVVADKITTTCAVVATISRATLEPWIGLHTEMKGFRGCHMSPRYFS